MNDFVSQYNSQREQPCRELLNYPHFSVGIGELICHHSPEDYTPGENNITISSMETIQAGIRSVNIAAGLEILHDDQIGRYSAVLNVTLKGDHLGIQAWSLLDPDDVDPPE